MGITSPWLADTESLLSGTVRFVVAAEALIPGSPVPVQLELSTNSPPQITHSETQAPRCTANIVVRAPDAALLAQLDPRGNARIKLYAGYVRAGGVEDIQPLAILSIRSRSVNRPENTVTLDLAGDEQLVLNNAAMLKNSGAAEVFFEGTTMSAKAIVQAILTMALPAGGYSLVVDPNLPLTPVGADVIIEEGGSFWQAIENMLDTIDADLWHDGYSTWYLEPRPAILSATAATFKVGAAGTITSSTSSLETAEWANAVVLKFRDVDGSPRNVWAEATAGPFSTAVSPRKVYTETRDADWNPRSAAAATALLRRMLSRGRTIEFDAVDPLWLRPGHTITVQLPTGAQERVLVSSTRRTLGSGIVTIATRYPDQAVTIDAGG